MQGCLLRLEEVVRFTDLDVFFLWVVMYVSSPTYQLMSTTEFVNNLKVCSRDYRDLFKVYI